MMKDECRKNVWVGGWGVFWNFVFWIWYDFCIYEFSIIVVICIYFYNIKLVKNLSIEGGRVFKILF